MGDIQTASEMYRKRQVFQLVDRPSLNEKFRIHWQIHTQKEYQSLLLDGSCFSTKKGNDD